MINLKQNGSGQNINLSPIYHQIVVLDENTYKLSKRIDTIQTGSVDLSEIENSISILNNSVATVQTDLNSVKIDVNNLNLEVDSIKTNLISVVSDVSILSSNLNNLSTNHVNYYDVSKKLTERPFNYNISNGFISDTADTLSAIIYGEIPVSSYKNPWVCIKANVADSCTFNKGYKGYSSLCIDNFNHNFCSGENLILNGVMDNKYNTYNIDFFLGNYPTFSLNSFANCKNLNFHDQYFLQNTILTNHKINNNGLICENNSLSSVKILNLNNCSVNSNSLKNVKCLNCVGEIFGKNTYINQSNYPYQCQLMNEKIVSNKFVNPDLLNITCEMFRSNSISNASFVDVKCDYLYNNEFYNMIFLKVHNVQSTGCCTYRNINDLYIENFLTKLDESISNVKSFRFNNGSTNLYDSDLKWTLTNINYNIVESNVVHCGDFNPIPYIRSINKHLESIETKLTQISPESDVFVKKINVSNLANNTTFSSADSLKINCLTVQNFNCSDISSLKINGASLESGMFSNIKSVEINAINCNELTFDNVEYIKVNCVNKPDIYCSNIGTVKLNNYNKIQLQKFNLFEAPQPNNYFYSCYMCHWNVNAPESNAYDAHFMTDYRYNSDSYATVKFKFNVDTFEQTFADTVYIFENSTTTQRITTNRLLFWRDNTFKMGNAVEHVGNNGYIESAYNVLMNYKIQFDMPYMTTNSNYYA